MTVELTEVEVRVIKESLTAHLAGDCYEGDLCWNGHEVNAAERVMGKLAGK